jgi:cysteine desulfurase
MIYLDNNASTKMDSEVEAAFHEAVALFGNPSSVHAEGRRARRAIEEARDEVARLIGAAPEEVFFTSGGTEANAMAILGAGAGRARRIVRTGAEHPSVREATDRLREEGTEVEVVDPEPSGELDPARILAALVPGTDLVTVMAANNEYGGVFPVPVFAPSVRERGALIHTDAVQAAGRMEIDAHAWGVDLLTISAHKFHGPKGVGALYVHRGVPLRAHTPGGGQEKKLRAGTENTAGIVGFGVAARLARARLGEAEEIRRLRDRLERGILEGVEGSRLVGAGGPRLPNTSAVLFEGLSGEALLVRLDLEGVAASVGSACSSGTLAPSPAILSLGLPPQEAKSVVRFSLSRFTTEEEIDTSIGIVARAALDARKVLA